jgi:hypothetical protein
MRAWKKWDWGIWSQERDTIFLMGMIWIAKSCCLEHALSVLVMSEFITII